MNRTTSARRSAQIAALLMAEPRSPRGLLDAMGLSKHNTEYVKPFLSEFYDLGCIYIKWWHVSKFTPEPIPVYAWQPHVFAVPDAVRPERCVKTK